MDDKQLLSLIRHQPSEGIRLVVERYGGLVKTAVVLVLGNNHADTEECVADAFIKLWKSADRLTAVALKSYLYTLARNTAIDRLRKESRSPDQVTLEEITTPSVPAAEEEYAKQADQRLVAMCMEELPEPDRDIFRQRYYCGKKVGEIAQDLGIKQKKVENILYRGKKKLERRLMEMGVQL